MGGCAQSYNAAGDVLYNYAQLEAIWIKANGDQNAQAIAAAIAMAESRGHSMATCVDTNGSTDRGLWQINTVHGSMSTYDVMGNARAAVSISNNGKNWGAWSTYNNGAYRQFMQNIPPADPNTVTSGTDAASATALQTQTEGFSIGCFLNPAFCLGGLLFGKQVQQLVDFVIIEVVKIVLRPFFNYIAGVFGVVAGASLMVIGIVLLIMDSQAGQQAIKGGVAVAGVAAGQPEVAAAAAPRGLKGTAAATARSRQAPQTPRQSPVNVTTSYNMVSGVATQMTERRTPEGGRVRNVVSWQLNNEAGDYQPRGNGKRPPAPKPSSNGKQ